MCMRLVFALVGNTGRGGSGRYVVASGKAVTCGRWYCHRANTQVCVAMVHPCALTRVFTSILLAQTGGPVPPWTPTVVDNGGVVRSLVPSSRMMPWPSRIRVAVRAVAQPPATNVDLVPPNRPACV